MKPELLDDLVCPYCRVALALREEACVGGEIETGTLSCSCGRTYPIRKGVPRLLPDRLAPEDARVAGAFSYEWDHFRIEYDAVAAHFLEWIHPLTAADFAGKRVLDAGCGMGRHTREAARFGAARVFALDFSSSVDVARDYARGEPAVHVIQADLRLPPLRGDVDLAYSMGVLNQMPDPQAGFSALASVLRPGGRLFAWVYAAEAGRLVSDVIDPLRAHVTSHLPFPLLRMLTWPPAVLVRALSHAYAACGQGWPQLRDHLPWFAYFRDLSRVSFPMIHCTLFDQLVAPSATYCRQDELIAYFQRAGFADVHTELRHRNGWRGLGARPTSDGPGNR